MPWKWRFLARRAFRLGYPPLKVFRFSSESLRTGIETHTVDGVPIRVYSREKTLADLFKYRNKVARCRA